MGSALGLWTKLERVFGGCGAFNSLRMEKGYRMWGADFHTDYNPWEAGSGWAVKLEKRDFVGRNTLVGLA